MTKPDSIHCDFSSFVREIKFHRHIFHVRHGKGIKGPKEFLVKYVRFGAELHKSRSLTGQYS